MRCARRRASDDVIHVAPTRSMLADALAQYLVWKKWSRWVLAFGSHDEDALLADAYRRAAKRFGARIVAEIVYEDTGGSRQTNSGVIQTQQQMPVFTQRLPEYDVLVAADENEVFAGYLPYRTWDARPVAGSAGLRPVTLGRGQRFLGRRAVAGPFHAHVRPPHDRRWTCRPGSRVRMIGEAASRGRCRCRRRSSPRSGQPGFGVAAYKGQLLTCATGTGSCASRSCCRTGGTWYRYRPSRASCTR